MSFLVMPMARFNANAAIAPHNEYVGFPVFNEGVKVDDQHK